MRSISAISSASGLGAGIRGLWGIDAHARYSGRPGGRSHAAGPISGRMQSLGNIRQRILPSKFRGTRTRASGEMKQIAIAIVLCVGAWYFFIGGRKLDEPM